MASQVYFNGKLRKLPGAYSKITSGEQNTPARLDYGKVMVIDTGLGATYGGGAGINSIAATPVSNGKDAVYQFQDVEEYKAFLKGGLMWKLAEKMFFPYSGVNGVSTVYHVKAAVTDPASMTFTATGGGTAGGTFKVKCKDEGVIGNGVLSTTHLDRGFGYSIETGVVDATKWIFKIWQGTWKGIHTDGLSYDEVVKADTTPILAVASPEFNNIQTLIDWATSDQAFGNHFILDSTSTKVGTGEVTLADITALVGSYQLASGGLETYSTAALSAVFEAIKDLDFQFILCDKYGSGNFDSTEVGMIFAHIKDAGTDFNKTLVYGAGKDEVEFSAADGSIDAALYYNSNKAIVVHGGVKETTQQLAGGFRVWPAIYHAAVVLGRICGLQPQIPITNKLIGIDGLVHNIKVKEQERALDNGVVVTIQDNARGGFKVLQGVNSLQDNKFLFNSLGKSYSIQFERIVNQINRELVVNSQTDLLNNENGVNVNTLSPGILKTWTETYLQSRVAKADSDDLLLSFRNVVVSRTEDYYNVTYGIVVNNEVTKIFYTGFLFKS